MSMSVLSEYWADKRLHQLKTQATIQEITKSIPLSDLEILMKPIIKQKMLEELMYGKPVEPTNKGKEV